jgi:DNA-binding XRE family transcriptional regulator
VTASQHAKSVPDPAPGDVGTRVAEAVDRGAFVRGSERLGAVRDRHPELANAVEVRRAERRQADRAHAMGLAVIRQAANLTQTELASILGVGQAAIAKIEKRPDLLLSTLNRYLEGLGGRASVVVDFGDGASRVEVALEALIRKSVEPPRTTD